VFKDCHIGFGDNITTVIECPRHGAFLRINVKPRVFA
jgi:hypothetical protein